ncbi:hypothetical protein KI387_022705, partial [Taxus chinensis]
RLSVMVPDVTEMRLISLFIAGLTDALVGFVEAFEPSSLHEAVRRARDLELSTPKSRVPPRVQQKEPPSGSDELQQREPPPRQEVAKKPIISQEDRDELRRKKLCFDCHTPWVPGHDCRGRGKAQFIEVFEESEGDRGEELETREMDDGDGVALDSADAGQEEETFPREIIATLSSTLMYKAFRIRGVMQ